jgi:hypothetical protein
VQVSIVQFSNDTRVEVPLGAWEKTSFEAGIKNMVRPAALLAGVVGEEVTALSHGVLQSDN